MRFFTRDLYLRTQSADEATADRASADWDEANQAYERHLEASASKLSARVKEMNALLLHDAHVRSIARQGLQLILVLHKEIPPQDVVILTYELDGDPVLEPFSEAPRDWSRSTDFQFDELDVEEREGRCIFTQEIVFGNGWLMRLRFYDVLVSTAQPIHPALANMPSVMPV